MSHYEYIIYTIAMYRRAKGVQTHRTTDRQTDRQSIVEELRSKNNLDVHQKKILSSQKYPNVTEDLRPHKNDSKIRK